MISRFWVVVLPAIVMAQIQPLFLMNRSAFTSRIVIYVTNLLVRGFLSGYVFSQVQNPLLNSPLDQSPQAAYTRHMCSL
jgi:hypothetical protein